MGQAERQLATFNTAAVASGTKTGALAGAFGAVETAAGRVGGALQHAGSQLKGLITGPLGLIGLTGGLLSFGGAISSTLTKMNDLAFGTERLTAITGDSAQSLSVLIASTEKYGISVDKLAVIAGFYEKTAGKLNETDAKGIVIGKSAELLALENIKNERIAAGLGTTKIDRLIREQKARDALSAADQTAAAGVSKLMALQTQYSVQLVDASGKAVSFNTALLNVADAYATATDKANAAALASTLFGKSWQILAPILELGKQGILDLEKQAADMGLQLNESNIVEFAKYREAIRGSQEAISGLEVAIGLDLLPTIEDLARGLQSFVTDHKSDIVVFFHGAVSAGKQLASTLGGLVGTIEGFWNMIPAGFRDVLVRGFIADKTVKFLFGFSIAGELGTVFEKAILGAAAKQAATSGLSQLFGQRVFVTNWPPGFGTGGLPGAVAGAGEAGAAATALEAGAAVTVGSVIASVIAGGGLALIMAGVGEYILSTSNDPTGAKGRTATAAARGISPSGVDAGLRTGGPAVNAIGAAAKQIANAADDWKGEAHRFAQTMNAGDKYVRDASFALAGVAADHSKDYALTAGRDTLLKEIRDASIARYGGTGLGPAAVEATYEHRLLFATERIMDNGQSTDDKIAQLKEIEDTLLSQGDTKTRSRIDTLISKLQSQKPPIVNVTNNLRISASGYILSATTRTTTLTGRIAT